MVCRGEVQSAGSLAGALLGGGVGMIRDLHLSIADRGFQATGPVGKGAGQAHGAIARTVYDSVGGALRLMTPIGATVAALAMPEGGTRLDSSRGGNIAVGAINGLWGDRLHHVAEDFTVSMSVRVERRNVPLTAVDVTAAFPNATGRVAVFLHGLCETDDAWQPTRRKQLVHGSFRFGERLRDHGFTPVYVRYNSGLRIPDNGAELSRLLERLSDVWPTDIDEFALIGHSMGGLVARSACHLAFTDGCRWVEHVRRVFCLGSPHLGVPLARGVHKAAGALRTVPEARGLAALLDARSAGIDDLRFGTLVADDREEVDSAGPAKPTSSEVPFLPHAAYYYVAATVTKNRRHPLGQLVGDLLVHYASASGRGRNQRIPFDIDKGHHVGGLTHFDLLSHPDVYAQLERWITSPITHTGSAPLTR
jgi:pimeloyl-ACP methyl ester carboxylesterase